MTDVVVTLTAAEKSAAEMALENVFNLLPTRNAELVHEASALAKLRAAQPAAPGPLDRLEAWLAEGRGALGLQYWPAPYAKFGVTVNNYAGRPWGVDAPTLAEAVDAALKQAQEAQP